MGHRQKSRLQCPAWSNDKLLLHMAQNPHDLGASLQCQPLWVAYWHRSEDHSQTGTQEPNSNSIRFRTI